MFIIPRGGVILNNQLNLLDLISVFLKRWWIIFISIVVIGGVSFVYSQFFIQPIYVSKGTLYVQNTSYDVSENMNISDINASQQLVNTYIEILRSNTFLNIVSNRCGLDYTPKEIKSMISMASVNETEIFSVSVRNPNPEYAMKICQTILVSAQEEIARIVSVGNVKIVDNANSPTAPSSPNVSRNTFLGTLFGVILGMFIILALETLDIRVKSEADLADKYDLPILGVIPTLETLKK